MIRFKDRRHAGRVLVEALVRYAGRDDVVVLALPRGGVPVAYEVATALRAPLDVFLVRKLGLPGHEELAMGAVAAGGVEVLNEDVIRMAQVPRSVIDSVVAAETHEMERRERAYREGRAALPIRNRVVILVDDGLATGASMRAAVFALRRHEPARIVAAVPVGAASSCDEIAERADEMVCPLQPADFRAVGLWYEDFSQTGDDEVRALLAAAAAAASRFVPTGTEGER
jgi:putative phosphoribosyl transferase